MKDKKRKVNPVPKEQTTSVRLGSKKKLCFKRRNKMKDKIVEDLKREFDIRSCVGIDKYKTTLQDNKHDDFLQHLKEELMDAALYIQKLQSNGK